MLSIQITHPEWLPEEFSHVGFPPFNWRLDEVGMLAFAVAAVGFFLWQLNETEPHRVITDFQRGWIPPVEG